MECREVRELYSPWLDGELGSPEAQAVREHLEGCAACREELALWEKLSLSLKDIKEEVPAPQGFGGGVMARIQELGTPVVKRRRRRPGFTWKQLVAGVAAAALLAWGAAAAKLPNKLPLWKGTSQVAEREPSPPAQAGHGPAAPSSTVNKPVNSGNHKAGPGASGTPAAPAAQPGKKSGSNQASPTGVRVLSRADSESPVFLNKVRKISSTLLKVQVGDVDQARVKALGTASKAGASAQQVAQQSAGDKQTVILRLVVPPDKAGGCLDTLAGLGTVLVNQTETRDVTSQFASTLDQYRELVARRASTRDAEQKAQLDQEIKDLEDLLTTWDEEAQQQVIVLWLEEEK